MNRNTLKQWLKETAALMMLMCCAAGAVYAGLGESSVMNTASLEVGDPINAANGEHYFSKELLNLGGMPHLKFQIYYGSFAEFYDAEMPVRFMHNLDESVQTFGSDTWTQAMVFFDMKQIFFLKENNPESDWELRTNTSVPYRFAETSGYYYLFDPETELLRTYDKSGSDTYKKIVRVQDPNGNSLTYQRQYSSQGGHITSAEISDGLGRKLKITYEKFDYVLDTFPYSKNHPVKVEDQNGRAWTLGYEQDPNERIANYDNSPLILRTLTDPMGNITRFNYGGKKRMISQVLPQGNIPYINGYDSSGAWNAVTQTDAYGNVTQLSKDVYTDSGKPSQFTATYPDGTKQVFNHDKLVMKSMSDASDNTASFEADTSKRITSVTDRLGDKTSFTYHAESGKIASLTNAEGKTVTYTYTLLNYVFTNPVNSEQVKFDCYKLSRVDYPDKTSEQFSYNDKGNMTNRTDRGGKVWSYTYDSRGLMLTAANPAGGVITNTYNADGTLASSKDSETGTRTYGYDTFKRMNKITHPDGKSVQIAYDMNDRITSVTDENSRAYSYAYDANGNLTEVTDPAGKKTQYAYDLMDRVNKITDRLGKVSEFAYDSMGRLKSATDPNLVKTENTYDPRGWLNKITRGGSVWETGYDDEGLASSSKTPLGNITEYQTDKLGYLTKSTDPLGYATTFGRDDMSRITAVTDPLARTVNYGYDAQGLLANVTVPVIGTASYTRNDIGSVTKISDLNGKDWNFGYSKMGRLLSETDPLSNRYQYEYDTQGRISKIIYPDNATQSITYDNAGNIIRISYSANPDLQFAYDPLDRLISANSIAFTRDAEGRITETSDSGLSFGAAYDDGGRLKTVSYNNGAFTVSYGYEASTGLLNRVTDSLTNTTVAFAYDTDRRLTGITRSNSVNGLFDYDNAARLIRIREGNFVDVKYTLDASGQVIQADMTAPLLPHDAISRNSQEFAYDAASQISTAGYVYDDQGRMTRSPDMNLTWDGASCLTGIGDVNLSYNGMGDLLTRNEVRYFYNYAVGMNPIMAEKNESGGFLRYYVWTPGGQLLYMIDAANGNKVYFYHFDRTGSTLALTDSKGAVTDKYAYDPYGKMLRHEGTNPQPFTFVGRFGIRQENASVYHIRARYYDATIQRFFSRDPIDQLSHDDPRMINPYQYAFDNPVSYIDLNGMFPKILLKKLIKEVIEEVGGEIQESI